MACDATCASQRMLVTLHAVLAQCCCLGAVHIAAKTKLVLVLGSVYYNIVIDKSIQSACTSLPARPRSIAKRLVNSPGSALAGGRAVQGHQAPAAQLAAGPRQRQLALPLKVAAARVAAADDRHAEPAGLERARSRSRALRRPHHIERRLIERLRNASAQLHRLGARRRPRAKPPELAHQRGVRQAGVQAPGLPCSEPDLARAARITCSLAPGAQTWSVAAPLVKHPVCSDHHTADRVKTVNIARLRTPHRSAGTFDVCKS